MSEKNVKNNFSNVFSQNVPLETQIADLKTASKFFRQKCNKNSLKLRNFYFTIQKLLEKVSCQNNWFPQSVFVDTYDAVFLTPSETSQQKKRNF